MPENLSLFTDTLKPEPAVQPISDDVAIRVHAKLGSASRKKISVKDVEKVLAGLNLAPSNSLNKSPYLRIQLLKFSGEKNLRDKPSELFEYTQKFVSGVNVVLIPDNDVGKSTILKTIKFALTGDDNDYDSDVRSWIKNIWLVFNVDERQYTIQITRDNGSLKGLLVLGDNMSVNTGVIIGHVTGAKVGHWSCN